jgi:Mg-chelatase subunit ChlD
MQDPIDVSYAVNCQYFKSNSRGTVFLALGIDSPKKTKDPSKTCNLSLVMDRSSSMERQKKFEQAKEAAVNLFNLLRDSNTDQYGSVICFDKSAKVALASSKISEQESAENIIRNLQLGRGTNIYEGLELAYKEISKHTEEEPGNKIVASRLVLLSDGQASVGKMDEEDFVSLSEKIREDGITISTIGIGDDYDQQLLHAIAEAGGGVPYHVKEVKELEEIFSTQAEEMSSTVLISPMVTITLMPGAEIQEVYTVAPTLRKQNLDKSNNNNRYVARLKDIIGQERQILALRANLPERKSGTYRLARVEVNDLVKNMEVKYTPDHLLYSKETDPYPRMIFACSEAASLVNKGVLAGDHESIRKAETMIADLSKEKGFEIMMSKRLNKEGILRTIKDIIERVCQGPLMESEKKEVIHETTMLFK